MTKTNAEPKPELNIYQRLHAVMGDVSYVQKEEKMVNNQYRFVSHDGVTAAVRPALLKHGVIYYPQNLKTEREILIKKEEKWVDKNKVLVDVTYNFTTIPVGFLVCHKCDNPSCIRPDHLFLGTASDNVQDSIRKKRNAGAKATHCKNGHKFTPKTTKPSFC